MPRSCKGHKLPVDYANQKAGWMDRHLFADWYDNKFIPAVKKHQRRTDNHGKVVLVLDNAPSHPPAADLVRDGGRFSVKYLCPRVTALIQPMDQAVIATMKKLYRKYLLEDHLLDFEGAPDQFVKSFTIKQAIELIAKS